MSGVAPLPEPLPALVVGERLCLEHWRSERLEEVHELVDRSRPTLAGFLPWAATPLSLEDEEAVRLRQEREWQEGRMVNWMILEDGAVRGMVGLHRRGGPDELEIGYWLDDRATGRGIMTDACTMATDVAFTVEGIDAVEIIHDLGNLPSAGVPARLGFSRVCAFSSAAHASLETGIKVRWVVRRAAWRRDHPESSVLEAS